MTATTKVGLNVLITGVCLFVPVRKRKRIAVLMPQTQVACSHDRGGGSGGGTAEGHLGQHGDPGHGGGRHVRHVPHRSVIAVPKDHLAPVHCTEEKDGWCIIDLAHWSLTLSNGAPPESYDLGGIYNVSRGGANRRAKSVFGAELQARVDLESGRLVRTPRGKRFRIDGGKEHMPNYVLWAIADCEPKLTLKCLRCGDTLDIPLDPKDKDSIDVLIQHVPPAEVGPSPGPYPKPNPNTPIHHFYALDQLLEEGHDPIDVPVWEDASNDDTVQAAAPTGGNPYTCMPGEGGPGDDGP